MTYYKQFLLFCLLLAMVACKSPQGHQTGTSGSKPRSAKVLTPFQTAVNDLYDANDYQAIQETVKKLDSLASTGKGWIGQYYVGYGYGKLAHAETDMGKVDQWRELGSTALDQAQESGAPLDEILVLRANLMYSGIKVNVMSRGFNYSATAIKQLEDALSINADNPRANLLMAQHYLNVPAQFGGDAGKACELNKKALLDFQGETRDQTKSPRWGYAQSQSIESQTCNQL